MMSGGQQTCVETARILSADERAQRYPDAEQLKAIARERTGLTDFGPEPFEESLDRLIRSCREDSQLSAVGHAVVEHRLLDSLQGRLRIQKCIIDHPEVLDIPIDDPVIITGLNRTGTTKLHRTMATHPGFRTLPLWEALNPLPLPGEQSGDNSQRIIAAEAMVDNLRTHMPQAHAGHPIFATEPEEETYASQMQLQWSSWFGYAHVPSYMHWVANAPMTDAYRWFRKVMQVMVWQNGGTGKRWLLKAPFHLGYLDDLVEVFPSVRIILCHRNPIADPIASIATLVASGRPALNDSWDLASMGPEFLDYLSTAMKRTVAQRAGHLDRIFDVNYNDTFLRAETLLQKIYGWLDMPYGALEHRLIGEWEAGNPQHKHGKFTYSIAETGISATMVDSAFGPYAAWVAQFAVRDRLTSGPACGQSA